MNIKIADVFTSTTGVCIHVNLSCLHDFRNDGVTPFDMIDKAVSEYDANQALITKQAEKIKVLRSTLIDTLTVVQGGMSSAIENCVKALELTKEQS